MLLKRLRAIAEPNRLAILGLLHGSELCLCEIEDIMRMSQPRA
ncbi:MAG: ArsR family transcriptional regulator [Bacillota bacterium]